MAHLLSSLYLLALTNAPEPPAERLARAAITLELSQAGAYLPGDSVSVRVHVETAQKIVAATGPSCASR